MPPKQKYTKEEIITTALNLVQKNGITALTARGLGTELGTSSRPIFTAFMNMDEVRKETVKAARTVYNGYIEKAFTSPHVFQTVGIQYLIFAKEEPRLFELLFMTPGENASTLNNVLPMIDDNSDRILVSIQDEYGLSKERSLRLYQSLWIFIHGIACLNITKISRFTQEEMQSLMTDVFIGVFTKLKGEENQND